MLLCYLLKNYPQKLSESEIILKNYQKYLVEYAENLDLRLGSDLSLKS